MVTVDIREIQSLRKKLNGIPKRAMEDVIKAIQMEMLGVESEAKESILEHRSSGREYVVTKDGKIHTASTIGNPPNSNTGNLVSSIHTIMMSNGAEVGSLGSKVKYGKYLEEGKLNRPFLRPALDNNLKAIEMAVDKAMERSVNL